ncbi:MAG: hypothetical protein AB1742_01045 [bacterium]
MDIREGEAVYHEAHGVGRVAMCDGGDFIVEFEDGGEEVYDAHGWSDAGLTRLDAEGFHLRVRDDPAGVREAAETDPARVIVWITRDYTKSVPMSLVERLLRGKVIGEEDWDKWEREAAQRLSRDPRFVVEGKDTLVYRGEADEVSLQLLEEFRQAGTLKGKYRVCREFMRVEAQGVDVRRNREAAVSFFGGVARNATNRLGARVEAMTYLSQLDAPQGEAAREQLMEELGGTGTGELAEAVGETTDSAVRREMLLMFRERRGEELGEAVGTLVRTFRRHRDWALDFLMEADVEAARGLAGAAFGEPSTNMGVFLWLCRNMFRSPERLGELGVDAAALMRELFRQLSKSHLTGAFSAHPKEGPYTSREEAEMLEMLSDVDAVVEFLRAQNEGAAAGFWEMYDGSAAIDDDLKDRMRGEIAAITGDAEIPARRKQKEETYRLTRESYEKYREELRKLVEEDIPANLRDIRTAREWGDLSENAEYHAARERQQLLRGRKLYLEKVLGSCEVIEGD